MRRRILIAVSSIGLGHAARARVYGALLERMGVHVSYYAPEPAASYLEAWGMEVLPISRRVKSLSIYLEEYWIKSRSGVISLRGALKEHKASLEAGRLLLDEAGLESYDLIVGEESWEVISVAEHISVDKAWITDFIGYTPQGFSRRITAWIINRFLLKRYKYFKQRIYVGMKEEDLEWRMTPLGPPAREVLKEFTIEGPIPAFIPGEELDRGKARSMLSLPEDKTLILIQLGGTRAGEELVYEAATQALKHGLTPVIASGPRAKPRAPRKAYTIGYNPLLPKMLKAFDCAYTLAGLSTIASLAAAGVPAVLNPLPGHFEQESNAVNASRTWPSLFYNGSNPWRWLINRCNSSPDPAVELHMHAVNVSRILAGLASPPL